METVTPCGLATFGLVVGILHGLLAVDDGAHWAYIPTPGTT